MKYTINLTQKHIDRGRPRSCFHCPVALAIQDGVGRTVGVMSLHEQSYACFENGVTALPPAAVQLARDFDQGRPVQPMSFELEVP